MTATLTKLPPAEVAARLKAGQAVLVDIREADEFAALLPPGTSRPIFRICPEPA